MKFQKETSRGSQLRSIKIEGRHKEEINPIYTENNNCQDCYKCLRQCPVKAIKIEGGSASVIPAECIYCGHCVQVCPAGAKKVRNDIQLLTDALDKGEKVIASLAPSYISEFPGIKEEVITGALKKIGFMGVSETALGAEIVSRETLKIVQKRHGEVVISSCCPSVVLMINRFYPQLTDKIAPVLSPMQAHAKMLKEVYGAEIRSVFFGPCIAKKCESDNDPELTDLALTFSDLRNLLDLYYPDWELHKTETDDTFIPSGSGKGSYFPVDGGMIAAMREQTTLTDGSFMSFSGVKRVKEVLNDLSEGRLKGSLFLELMICEGGCVKGPCIIDSSSEANKRQKIINEAGKRVVSEYFKGYDTEIAVDHNQNNPLEITRASETEITNALRASGKFSDSDELNCGGCGYDSCRDFAVAMLRGKAERIMCVSYTRRVAQDKASVLLKKIPYGVVVVDDTLRIIDANNIFTEIIGKGFPEILTSVGSIEGSDLKKAVSFHRLFNSVLHSGEEMVERRIKENGLLLNVSVITIQPHKIVCGIIRDLQDPEVQKEHILKTSRQVIHQNMEVVQKIAFLLGENAAYTESMLNSIVESVDNENETEEK